MKYKFLTFLVFAFIIAGLPCVFAQTITCEELTVLPFGSSVVYPTIIDAAINCGFSITNEQFILASPEQQQVYVLSGLADFSYEEQNSIFMTIIMNDKAVVNDSTKESIKDFLTFHEDYSFADPKSNITAKQVFEKIANISIETINEINDNNQNNVAFQRYFNTSTNFLFVNCAFESYDNESRLFTTKGDKKTSFSTSHLEYFMTEGFSDFFIMPDGRLNAAKYHGAEICTNCDYTISADGKSINVNSGKFKMNDREFSSDNPYIINIQDDNEYQIEGKHIIGINPENGETIFKVNGKITIKAEDQYTLGSNSYYEQYKNNKPQFQIEADKKTEIFTSNKPVKLETFDYETISPDGAGDVTFESTSNSKPYPCKDFEYSCAYWNPATNTMDVKLIHNKLTLQDDNKIISYLNVEHIVGEESMFNYYSGASVLKFDLSGVTELGNHNNFPQYTSDFTYNDKKYELISGTSSFAVCTSPCEDVGSAEKGSKAITPVLPKSPPSKVDSIMVITANPFEGQNKLEKDKVKTIAGLYVLRTVESAIAESSKIPVINTIEKYTPLKTATDIYVMTSKEYYKLNEAKQVNDPKYKNMVVLITGHHGPGKGNIYSEHFYFKDEISSNDLEFSRGLNTPASQKIFDLKYNENVYVVMFSACQTVKMPYEFNEYTDKYIIASYPKRAIKDLNSAYPNLRLIIGYDNIAPGIDLIYNTRLDRGATPNANLFNNPKDTGLINFNLLEGNDGFKAFGNKALDIYKVDLDGLAEYRKTHPYDSESGSEGVYSDRYWNGKRTAYYIKETDGNWYFHTNYAYDKKTDRWSRKDVVIKINLTEGVLVGSPESKAALNELNS